MITFELILLGLFVGAVTGITGASGVLIMVPVLTTFFDMPIPVILGTSLFVDVIASVFVAYTYAKNKHLEIKNILWLLVGSLLGAQAGSFFVVSVSKAFIMFVISVAMIFFGIKMWKSGLSTSKHNFIILPERLSKYVKTTFGLVVCGLVIGLTTGIFGAGGGLTIFIVLYSFLNFPLKTAIGTSSFVMLVTALSGVIGYSDNGNLNLYFGLLIGISAAIGGGLSSIFANRINDKVLTKLISIFFIFLATLMLVLKVLIPLFIK